MTPVQELLQKAVAVGASDLHLTVAAPPVVRARGRLAPLEGYEPVTRGSLWRYAGGGQENNAGRT